MTPFVQTEQPGSWKALTLTVLMHLLLLAVLFFGVQWKRNAPTVVEAELWSARPVPEVAPPPPPEPKPKPEPKPVKPDIAVKEEKKPPKPEPKKPEPAPKPQMNDVAAALKREEMAQKLESDKAQLAASNAKRAQVAWMDKIRNKIRLNMVSPPNIQGNPTAVFTLILLPTGEILTGSLKLKRPSSMPAWDTAAERAILKSSPFPKPDDPTAFRRDIDLILCPNEELGCR